MLNLMVDKETLALHENAIIVQVGLVVFDGNFNPVTELDLKIDVTASLLDGFESDPGTAHGFWAKQPDAIIRSVLYDGPRLPPKDAARVFDKWLNDVFKDEEFSIWADGILFDIPKIDNLFNRYGMKPLTARTRCSLMYDFRTLHAAAKQLYPIQYAHAEEILKNDAQHNALADCHWQVAMLSAVMGILGGKYEIVDEDDSKVDPNSRTEYRPTDQNPATNEDDEKRWEDDEFEKYGDEFTKHLYNSHQNNTQTSMMQTLKSPNGTDHERQNDSN